MKYIDALIVLNNGLASLIGEFLADDSVKDMVVKDDEGNPTSIKMNNFPKDKDVNKKRMVYIRVTQEVADLLQSKNFLNKRILAMCPSGGLYDEATGMTKSIYDLLQENAQALSTYNEYCFHSEFIKDDNGMDISNPRFGEFRALGRFA